MPVQDTGHGAPAQLPLVLGLPAVLIPNGLFAREIEPTRWSYPVWAITSILAGLVMATYVRNGLEEEDRRSDRDGRRGIIGTALAWFAPLQPVLAVAGMVLLAWALRSRLRVEVSCPTPTRAALTRVD